MVHDAARTRRILAAWTSGAADPAEVARWRDMPIEEKLRLFLEACALAHEVVKHRPDAAEVYERSTPLAPAAEALWRRLVAEGRRGRAHHRR